jgi:hypothetical protein
MLASESTTEVHHFKVILGMTFATCTQAPQFTFNLYVI